MANQFYHSGPFTTIIFDGSTSWDSLDPSVPEGYFPNGVQILWLHVKVATGDSMKIRQGSPSSEVYILDVTDVIGSGLALSLRGTPRCNPCVAGTDVSAGAKLMFARA